MKQEKIADITHVLKGIQTEKITRKLIGLDDATMFCVSYLLKDGNVFIYDKPEGERDEGLPIKVVNPNEFTFHGNRLGYKWETLFHDGLIKRLKDWIDADIVFHRVVVKFKRYPDLFAFSLANNRSGYICEGGPIEYENNPIEYIIFFQ